MEPASDMDKQTSVDESQVIGLIRHLLPVASGADEPSTQKTREQVPRAFHRRLLLHRAACYSASA